MTRRDLLSLTSCWATAATLGSGQSSSGLNGQGEDARDADITLRIGEVAVELAPRHSIKTLAYNGQVPGPILRAREGKPIVVDVWNNTGQHEMVHWHGFHIPSDVDGAHEEGTPPVPAHGHRRYELTPRPSGTRWYHSHGAAGRDLRKSTYSGQFGLFIVEPQSDPGRYDLEVPVVLHEWDPFFDQDMDVAYKLFSINGKMLGAGEPIRVRPGQRVLFRFLNASATQMHRIALPGHTFKVIALDGNAVPVTSVVPVIELGTAERVDAIVEMNNPGIWILGEIQDRQRVGGMGVVVEYAGQQNAPRWSTPPPFAWDYTAFGGNAVAPEPDGRFPLMFRAGSGHNWTINGKSYPHTSPLIVKANRRYRLVFDNQSADAHPMHLHRHTFEITRFDKKPTSGVFKDVVVVPPWRQVEVDVPAVNPGPTLFHCHQQYHMDFGFMAMMQYSD
jgi:FtsP/CotA-like multicopper oxidase with cupredoxin domain